MKILLLLLGTAVSLQAAAKTLSFQEAVEFALEHSPAYDSTVKSRDISTLTRQNSFAALLPSVDFSASGNVNENHPIGAGDPFGSSVGFTLSENLYDNGVSWTQYKISKINEEISKLTTLKARDNLILTVANQYFLYSQNLKLLDAKKEQLQTIEKQLSLVQRQFQQGFKTRKDYLRLKAQAQRAEIDLVNEKNTIEISANELRRLLGIGQDYNHGEVLEFAPVEPDSIPVEADFKPVPDDQIYDYRINKLGQEVSELNVDLAKRNYWPQVNLKLSGFYSNNGLFANLQPPALDGDGTFAPLDTPSGLQQGQESYGWSAILTINYNIFDWGQRKRAVEISENTKLIQDNSVRDTTLNVDNTIRQTVLQLKTLRDTYALQKELLEDETQNYEVLRADYQLGRVAYLDMITGLNNLLDAKLNYYSLYFQLLTSMAQFHFFEGDLYEKTFAKK